MQGLLSFPCIKSWIRLARVLELVTLRTVHELIYLYYVI